MHTSSLHVPVLRLCPYDILYLLLNKGCLSTEESCFGENCARTVQEHYFYKYSKCAVNFMEVSILHQQWCMQNAMATLMLLVLKYVDTEDNEILVYDICHPHLVVIHT